VVFTAGVSTLPMISALLGLALSITCHAMDGNTERVRHYRERQRKKGLRPVQLWLPDTSSARFRRQVAHDIAVAAELHPVDLAMIEAFERTDPEDAEWR
jgi:hypothetical protein